MRRSGKKNIRLGWIFFITCFAFAAVFARLIHIQIILGSNYEQIVKKQSSGELNLPATRGLIYDRNGMVVANNVVLNSLYAWPTSQKEVRHVAEYIEDYFHLPKGTAVKEFKLSVNHFSWIRRKLDDAAAERIAKDSPKGLYLQEETERTYPFGSIGKQILGFTNIDGKGQAGFELCYDSALAGQDGVAAYRRDGYSNRFRIKEQAIRQPIPGQSKLLTVDWKLQEIVEEELKEGVQKYNAESGMAVFLNNNNGEIIAMAHYDPNEDNPDKPQKLRVLTDQFEPGSVFKVITAAGLLEDSVIDINDSVFCENGVWKIGRRKLHDDKELGWINFRSIIEFSSNIGVGKCALLLGGERLLQYAQKFGLGQRLLSEWPGETSGYISKPKKWSDYNVASLAMGHSVAVNALQMTNAMAAIANGGILYKPRLILCDVDDKGNPINVTKPEVLSELISEETADTLRSFLRGVVENGTATKVNSPIVTIGGKTGTAQIYSQELHRYFWGRYMASFLGFFPAEKPMVTGIVVYRNPQPVHYGGYTAGPTFRRIAERYTMMNPDLFTVPTRLIAENSDKVKNTTVVPDLTGRLVVDAKRIGTEKNINVRCDTDSGFVAWQYPPADRLIFEGDDVVVFVQKEEEDNIKMVDLKGLTIREVSALMQHIGLSFKIKGNGRVCKQSIKPGEIVNREVECQLECRPI